MSIDLGRRARSGQLASYLPRWASRIPIDLWALIGVLLVALVLRVWPVGGLSTEYDEGVYWQSLRAMRAGAPLYTSVFDSQPPFFLAGIYPLYLAFGQTLAAARLAVALYSLAGIAAMYILGRITAGRRCGVLAAALVALAPVYAIESRTLQAEAPSLLWQVLALALALAAGAAHRSWPSRHLLAFASGVALALGILTKLWDIAAALPALLYLTGAFTQVRPRAKLSEALRHAAPLLALWSAGLLIGCLVVLLPFLGHLDVVFDQVVRFHTVAGQTTTRGLGYNLRLLAQSGTLYPLLALAIASSILASARRSSLVIPGLVWFAVSFLILVQQQPLFDHHRVLLAPPLALLGALALPLSRSSDAFPSKRTTSAIAGILRRSAPILVTLALLLGIGVSTRDARVGSAHPTALQRQAAAALARFTIPADKVASDDQYVAGLADRDVLPQLVDTSQVRITSGYLTTAQIERLITESDTRAVLFASGRFAMLPGFRSWVEAHFTLVANLPDGGGLYLKMPQGPQIT